MITLRAKLRAKPIAVGTILVLALAVQALASDASRCYAIRDAEKKNFCLATVQGDASRCYSIHDADLKNLCLGQVKGDRSRCYSIRDQDKKNLCLASAPR